MEMDKNELEGIQDDAWNVCMKVSALFAMYGADKESMTKKELFTFLLGLALFSSYVIGKTGITDNKFSEFLELNIVNEIKRWRDFEKFEFDRIMGKI